jgi:predicted GNAT family acetyltransferase
MTTCAPRQKRRLSEIERDIEGSKGRYKLRQGGAEAQLTYSMISPAQIIADHTDLPCDLRGTRAGQLLLDRLIPDARAEGVKITPLCPFVFLYAQAQFHPEWAYVFT